MPEYTITLDRAACDGIFACLVRDDRFTEREDGSATIDTDAPGVVDCEEHGDDLHVTVDDGRRGDAQQAAAACPVGAITVEDDP